MKDGMIQLSRTEIELGFAASCIESVASRLNKPYQEIVARMKRVGLIENYILPCYEALHSESREHVTDNVIECLTNWENAKL